MLLLFEPFDAGIGTEPSTDPVSAGYPAFQIVPTMFFTLLIAVLSQAVAHG